MQTCVTVPIILNNKIMYKNVYTNKIYKSPQYITNPVVLEEENKLLRAQLKASSESQQFLEDCIAEMAQVVYA